MENRAQVNILYTSDIHGNALPILYGTNAYAELGLAKYATIVEQEKQTNENTIVIDNGDLIQGTPLMTHYVKEHAHNENPLIGAMNQIGIDAAVIGNHEFNFGKNILTDAVKQSDFPWLSANILDAETNAPYFGSPYLMKTLPNGIRVAIVGVTTHYIPNWEAANHIAGLRFTDAFETLQKWVRHIREIEKPDVLIASYHGGFERDIETGEPTEPLTGENQGYKMCEQIEGIDVLLTGHQHRILTGKIRDVLVVQPGNNGSMFGKIQIELQYEKEHWVICDKHAQVESVAGVPADPAIIENIQQLEDSTQQWLDQPIGYIEGDMVMTDPLEARIKKHPFVEFIQTVQMEASGADISVTALLNNDSSGFTSTVTMRDIVSNYMYPNTLVVLALTGKDIIAALEKSAEYFVVGDDNMIEVNPSYITPKPQHYNYDMWEGINYTMDVQQPVGSRIKNVTYHGKSLEETATYHVVLNNYRASGGGNYDMFQNKPIISEIQKDMAELIREYFEKHPNVKASLTENFSVTVSE